MPKSICEMTMLIRREVARENLEVENSKTLLSTSCNGQRIKPTLIVAGSLSSYDSIATEQSVEPIKDKFKRFSFSL